MRSRSEQSSPVRLLLGTGALFSASLLALAPLSSAATTGTVETGPSVPRSFLDLIAYGLEKGVLSQSVAESARQIINHEVRFSKEMERDLLSQVAKDVAHATKPSTAERGDLQALTQSLVANVMLDSEPVDCQTTPESEYCKCMGRCYDNFGRCIVVCITEFAACVAVSEGWAIYFCILAYAICETYCYEEFKQCAKACAEQPFVPLVDESKFFAGPFYIKTESEPEFGWIETERPSFGVSHADTKPY
ncbi:MAG: hypothetical protein QOI63_484 [Thermoplasmata archaeon]|nr:hypothetical protein [Thermoplasmata archaeon]